MVTKHKFDCTTITQVFGDLKVSARDTNVGRGPLVVKQAKVSKTVGAVCTRFEERLQSRKTGTVIGGDFLETASGKIWL